LESPLFLFITIAKRTIQIRTILFREQTGSRDALTGFLCLPETEMTLSFTSAAEARRR